MDKIILKNTITDRNSKFTSVRAEVHSKDEIRIFLKALLKDSFFKKASHNSWAYRIQRENGSVIEGKNDDGETGAGMCILRELQRTENINTLVIVTRYFGGIHLGNDRFKHIINTTKRILEEK